MRKKYKSLDRGVIDEMKHCFYSIDLETTGSDPKNDDIIEVGIVEFVECSPAARYSFLVQTNKPLTNEIVAITGLTNQDLLGGVEQNRVWDEITSVFPGIQRHIICAHRADFDIGFLEMNESCNSQIFRFVDTMEQAQNAMLRVPNYKLDSVADYLGIKVENRHRALGDAEVCGQIMVKLIDHFDRKLKFYEEFDEDF